MDGAPAPDTALDTAIKTAINIVEPPSAQDHFLRAAHLQMAGEIDAAAHAYKDCLTIEPHHAFANSNLGILFLGRGHVYKAVELTEYAAKLAPTCGDVVGNHAVCLQAAHRPAASLEAYTRAIELSPESAVIATNYAAALCDAGRYEEAIVQAQRALWLSPDHAQAHANLGMAYYGVGRTPAAIAALRVGATLAPEDLHTRASLGIVLLGARQYSAAWEQFEHRFESKDGWLRRPYDLPQWRGEICDGIVVWGEQGIGDQILHASLVPGLEAFAGEIVLEVDPRLIGLFERSFPKARVISRFGDLATGALTHQIPAGSLGGVLRKTSADFKSQPRGYLKADPQRAADLRADLNIAPGEKLIGISWHSRNAKSGERKSCSLANFTEILKTPGVKFVDLQYGDTFAARMQHGESLAHLEEPDPWQDIDGLAALISACDLVITVSNSTAHLAAALGKPTWVLLASGAARFWYWGTAEVETPDWYPTARLFRQDASGWIGTFARVKERLAEFLNMEGNDACR